MPAPVPKVPTVSRHILYWILLIVVGCLAGGISGYGAAKSVAVGLDSRLSQLWSRVTIQQSASTSTTNPTPIAQIFPLETARRPVYPAVFANRSASPLVPVVRKTGLKLTEPAVLPADRIQGYGVSLTSDGWIVLPATVFGTGPSSDLGILWRSRLYPIKQAVRDRSTDLVFLKIEATNLPVTTFVSPLDVVPGLGVWAELEPRHFRPETIIATDARASREVIPSERLNRRFLVSLNERLSRPGAAVWADNGGLVGLVLAADASGGQVLPTSAIASALSQVLASRPLERSALGLKVQDISALVYEGARVGWPEQGILVRQISSTTTASFLQEGDIIERMDRDAFDGIVDLGERLLDYRPGTKVTLHGQRKGKSFQVDIPLQATTTGELLK